MTNEPTQEKMPPSRRQFLRRVGKAAAAAAAVGLASGVLYDAEAPSGQTAGVSRVGLPDFSVAARPGRTIAIVKGSDRVKLITKALELLGGIERFVRPGQTVVIKPNVAFASPPTLGATTNPELVAAVVRLCYQVGKARRVIVTDNPINDPASCFRISGIGRAAVEAGAEVVLPKDSLFAPTTVEGAKLIRDWPVYRGLLEKADCLIGIAPLKHHHRSGASMTMKNWYGLLGGRRNIFHQDIHTIIAELSMMVRPSLVILDAVVAMMSNGPTGGSLSDLARKNTLIASCDMVAADAFGCTLLGRKPSDLPYLAKAERAGSGTVDYQSLKPKLAEVG